MKGYQIPVGALLLTAQLLPVSVSARDFDAATLQKFKERVEVTCGERFEHCHENELEAFRERMKYRQPTDPEQPQRIPTDQELSSTSGLQQLVTTEPLQNSTLVLNGHFDTSQTHMRNVVNQGFQ